MLERDKKNLLHQSSGRRAVKRRRKSFGDPKDNKYYIDWLIRYWRKDKGVDYIVLNNKKALLTFGRYFHIPYDENHKRQAVLVYYRAVRLILSRMIEMGLIEKQHKHWITQEHREKRYNLTAKGKAYKLMVPGGAKIKTIKKMS